ncbi:MAG: GerMN domain-containing protein [Candidatus Eremiobacteraeota bacterium]|nr:GerMN domain-containing protein [Candidatus Eremiobacteraeota bacterium]
MNKMSAKKYLTVFFISSAISAVMFLAGCGFFHKKIYARLYFPDKTNQLLIPITEQVAKLTPQILMSQLEKGEPNQTHLLPLFPDRMSFPQVSANGSAIYVDFKTSPPAEKAPLLIPGILATFQQLPQYKTVLFSVNGNTETLGEGGVELGKFSLRHFWINDNLELTPFPLMNGEYQKTIIYLELRKSHYLVPVTIRLPGNIPIEKAAAAALTVSPHQMGWLLKSPLPPGFKILSISNPADKTITMVVHAAGTAREERAARRALALTFCGIPGVKYVRIQPEAGIFGWRPLQKMPKFVNILNKR